MILSKTNPTHQILSTAGRGKLRGFGKQRCVEGNGP